MAPEEFQERYSSDELPEDYPKHLRRPIRDQPRSERRQTTVDSAPQQVNAGNEDGDNLFVSQASDDDEDDDEPSSSDDGSEYEDDASETATRPSVPPQTPPQQSTSSSVQFPRVTGGRKPLPKQVFPDLDSEDEIIKNMKDEGYRDHLVAERLAREDRVAYNPKSIATRYARINRVLEQNLNKRLEDEESDWHEGDDGLLDQAMEKHNDFYKRSKAQIDRRYWSMVGKTFHKSLPRPRFSSQACRRRYERRIEGTASPPFEQDPDQNGRVRRRMERDAARMERREREAKEAREREAKMLERNRQKAAEATESARKRGEKLATQQKKKAEQEAEKAKKNAQREARQKERQQREQVKRRSDRELEWRKMKAKRAKEEEYKCRQERRERAKRERLEKKMNHELYKAAKKHENAQKKAKAQKEAQTTKGILHSAMNKALGAGGPDDSDSSSSSDEDMDTGSPNSPRNPKGKKPKESNDGSGSEDDESLDSSADDYKSDVVSPDSTPARSLRSASKATTGMNTESTFSAMDEDDDDSDDESDDNESPDDLHRLLKATISGRLDGETPLSTGEISARISKSTKPRADPRWRNTMTVEELRALANEREIACESDETKATLLFRLGYLDMCMNKSSIREILRERELDVLGNKHDLMERLAMDDGGTLKIGGSDYYEGLKRRLSRSTTEVSADHSVTTNGSNAALDDSAKQRPNHSGSKRSLLDFKVDQVKAPETSASKLHRIDTLSTDVHKSSSRSTEERDDSGAKTGMTNNGNHVSQEAPIKQLLSRHGSKRSHSDYKVDQVQAPETNASKLHRTNIHGSPSKSKDRDDSNVHRSGSRRSNT